MAPMVAFVLGLAGGAFGLLAAFYWFEASAINVVPPWAEGKPPDQVHEPLDQLLSAQGWIAATVIAAQEGGRLNKRAALWSAAAAATGAASGLVGTFMAAPGITN